MMNYSSLKEQLLIHKEECGNMIQEIQGLSIAADFAFSEFFITTRDSILQAWDFGLLIATDPLLKEVSIQELEAMNHRFYAPIEAEKGYKNCIGNPDYAHKLYGAEFGALFSAIYTYSRSLRISLIQENYLQVKITLSLFLKLHQMAQLGNTEYSDLLAVYREISFSDLELTVLANMAPGYCPQSNYYKKVIQSADFSDLRYLYRYGVYLSKYDFAIAEYISTYPEHELEHLAKFIVQSWVDGFVRAKKDYTIKRYANLMIPAGFERLGLLLIQELEKIGIEAIVSSPSTNGINRQYGYDHRFDSALTLDRESMEKSLTASEAAMENLKDMMALNAGPVYVDLFGETPFSPEAKSTALKLSAGQQQLRREQSARASQTYTKYYKREESSFTIIAFPSPEIGENFGEIFADTVKINLLDSNRYAKIQQNIIDVLDSADYVHVKGKPGNDTDIKVKMHPLTDPEHQTLFENCVADVNIPVGEVFTSPLLTGTNGTLHVEDIYLGSLRYFNLKITFRDGWVESYSCTNFSDMEEGKKYIHENLLLPHTTLPIGEFAIGTNTTAYQIAKKHDIMALLPILIIEKMGPHFAIGDTCYSHEEDAPHPSYLNGKEMIAVENEKSATRKDDPINAYTQKHMDITLPYEMLEFITAISKEGTCTDIIRDGRFVVPGTEELNIPLDEMKI